MTIHAEPEKLDIWLDAISDRNSVQEAANYSLRSRMASLHHYLPRAAILDKDSVEDVHQLRVSTRRVLAVLDLYGDILPAKPVKSLRCSLKVLHRASGAVRDLDVLAKRYHKIDRENAKRLLKALSRRRVVRQVQLTKLYLRLHKGDFLHKQTNKLLAKIQKSTSHTDLAGPWMKSQWAQLAEQFFEADHVDTNDLDGLHRFRIRCKQVRYGLELLAPVFTPQQRDQMYKFVEQLQERLGRLLDHAIAVELFRKWEASRNRTSKKCDLKRLAAGENKMLDREMQDFIAWWTPSIRADAHRQFEVE